MGRCPIVSHSAAGALTKLQKLCGNVVVCLAHVYLCAFAPHFPRLGHFLKRLLKNFELLFVTVTLSQVNKQCPQTPSASVDLHNKAKNE